ncbi:MAG: DUF542 domain-containing protein [Chloroflexota bacterium]
MQLIQIEQRATPNTLDVREVAPRERHPLIFSTFAQLAAGESSILVNDHDPKPLYYQFKAEQPGQAGWSYLEEGPEVWRVRITRLPDLATTPIMVLIAGFPHLRQVLDSFGLDTCCGGHFSVTEAAAEDGIDAEAVLIALRAVL